MGKKRRQPSLPKVRSLLDHYRKQTGRRLAEVSIEDPYGAPTHEHATLLPPPGRGGSHPDSPKEWLAPKRGRIKVQANKHDTVTEMLARRQIDDAMFGAARQYQRLHEVAAWAASVKSVDIEAPQISGGQRDYAAGIDRALAARDELKKIEAKLGRKLGEDGVTLLRDVLGAGKTIGRAATERGGGADEHVRWWGGMFRRCLRHLAEVTGFAVKDAYENVRIEDARQQRQRERQKENAQARKKGGKREAEEEPAA